jgi:hypothetical protein
MPVQLVSSVLMTVGVIAGIIDACTVGIISGIISGIINHYRYHNIRIIIDIGIIVGNIDTRNGIIIDIGIIVGNIDTRSFELIEINPYPSFRHICDNSTDVACAIAI